MSSEFAAEVGNDNFEVSAKLPEDLSARATGRRRRLCIGDDGHTAEAPVPLRKSLEHRHALCADRQAVRGVLHIAPGDDRAVGGFERSSNLETREARVGVATGTTRGGDQFRGAQ